MRNKSFIQITTKDERATFKRILNRLNEIGKLGCRKFTAHIEKEKKNEITNSTIQFHIAFMYFHISNNFVTFFHKNLCFFRLVVLFFIHMYAVMCTLLHILLFSMPCNIVLSIFCFLHSVCVCVRCVYAWCTHLVPHRAIISVANDKVEYSCKNNKKSSNKVNRVTK